MFNYTNLRDTAAALIRRFGAPAVLVTYEDIPAPDPADPPVRTRVEHPTIAVFLKYRSEDIDGTRVLAKDQQVLMHADQSDMPPEGEVEGDHEIVRDGIAWKMIQVSILKPGPVTMLYKVQVRQ